jgi:hypothetical protein
MTALRTVIILLLAAIALAAIPSAAGAQSRYCGNYSGTSKIYALKVTCRTAYHVIRNFEVVCDQAPPVRGSRTRTAPPSGRERESFRAFCSTGRSGTYRCERPFHGLGHPRVWTCRKHNFVVSWLP